MCLGRKGIKVTAEIIVQERTGNSGEAGIRYNIASLSSTNGTSSAELGLGSETGPGLRIITRDVPARGAGMGLISDFGGLVCPTRALASLAGCKAGVYLARPNLQSPFVPLFFLCSRSRLFQSKLESFTLHVQFFSHRRGRCCQISDPKVWINLIQVSTVSCFLVSDFSTLR